MTDAEADLIAYQLFASAHPAAAYADDAERFIAFAMEWFPGATRDNVIQALRDICADYPDDPEAQMCMEELDSEDA
ncbi:MAG: hypothetical protein HMLKMBBP_01529 [Planctomycetes bacterium]|nr:hypothetical protein [Planctomycetota bacterium]